MPLVTDHGAWMDMSGVTCRGAWRARGLCNSARNGRDAEHAAAERCCHILSMHDLDDPGDQLTTEATLLKRRSKSRSRKGGGGEEMLAHGVRKKNECGGVGTSGRNDGRVTQTMTDNNEGRK